MRAMPTISETEMLQQLDRMNEKDPCVRRDAIGVLTGVKDARVLYPMVKALQDDDPGIQQAAMDALSVFEDEAAVHHVLPLLSDRRVYVRNMAREILDKIGGYGINLFQRHVKDKDEDVRKMIADILGSIHGPASEKMLIEMLKDPCSNVRSSAAEGLGRVGDSSAVEALIALLNDEDWVALFAAGALGRIRDRRAIRPLMCLVSSDKIDLQIAAIEAVGQIGGEEAVDGLMEAMDSADPEAVHAAVKGIVRLTHGNIEKAVNRFGAERFFNDLSDAMNNLDIEETDVKMDFIQAFSVLRMEGGSVCILRLISSFEMDNPDILQMAMVALERLGEEDTLIGALEGKSNTILLSAIRVIGLLRSVKAVPSLINLFEGVDRDIRVEVVLALGRIGGKDSSGFLMNMLSFGEGHIRAAAARGLGIMSTPESVKILLNRLKEEEYPDVAGEIVNALVEIGQKNSIPSLPEDLAENLFSKKPYIREAVVIGLGTLGWPKVIEHARGMLSDENWRVRKACLETLNYLNVPGLQDALVTAASDEKDEIRMFVAQLASKYPEEKSVDLLISLLPDRNTRVACKAMEGLVRLKAARATPYLIELARHDDPPTQKAAIGALGELAAQEAEEILKITSSHHHPEVRDAAIEAYRKLRTKDNVIR